jgi:chromosome segregation ATPase
MTSPSGDLELAAGEQAIEVAHPLPAPSANSADTQEVAPSSPNDDAGAVIDDDAEFAVTWRGYDRGQVDSYRSRMEKDLASTRIAYRRAVRAQAQFSELFRSMEADLARLRAELANTPSGLSQRLREILQLAAQDAEDTRAVAQVEARQRRADAQAEADQVRANAQEVLKEAREAAAAILSRAQAEQEKVRSELEQEQATVRQRVADEIAEAEQAREHADATAATRRDEADRQARERREQANAAAAAQLRRTSEDLAELTRQREEAVASLSVLRERLVDVLNPPNDTQAATEPASS